MSTATHATTIAQTLTKTIERPPKLSEEVNTVHALCELAAAEEWGPEEWALADLFSKRIDISGKLFAAYSATGRKKSKTLITDSVVLELACAVTCRALEMAVAKRCARAKLLKRLNTVFKAAELSPASWLSPDSDMNRYIEEIWNNTIAVQLNGDGIEVTNPLLPAADEMTTLPLTVLFYEGPIARAYLETMYAMGFRAQKIIHLIAAKDIATKAPVGRWLPRSWRAPYAYSIQRNRIHHWPKQIARQHRALYDTIVGSVAEDFGFAPSIIAAANAIRDLSTFSDVVEPVLMESLSDASLFSFLNDEPESAILYTGGGIVPAALLSIPQLQFIHIHPGYLPQIRGADCTLWSSLLTGHFSATCFYMAPGIDTGDVIMPRWLPKFTLRGPANSEVDVQTQYRSVYGFLDPWVRAFVLREFLATHDTFMNLDANPQELEAGTTFHFMHGRVREAALKLTLDRG